MFFVFIVLLFSVFCSFCKTWGIPTFLLPYIIHTCEIISCKGNKQLSGLFVTSTHLWISKTSFLSQPSCKIYNTSWARGSLFVKNVKIRQYYNKLAGLRLCQTPSLVGVARFYQISVILDGGWPWWDCGWPSLGSRATIFVKVILDNWWPTKGDRWPFWGCWVTIHVLGMVGDHPADGSWPTMAVSPGLNFVIKFMCQISSQWYTSFC